MKIIKTEIEDVLVLEPKVFHDARGFFTECYNQKAFYEATGQQPEFVQDNHSRSSYGVLRGMHYQVGSAAQAKLLRVVQGRIFDVAVDMRAFSPTFGAWVGQELSAENHKQMWIPEGFAHGFLVLSESADIIYKTTNFYSPEHERSVRWDDSSLAIEWPELEITQLLATVQPEPLLSAKDAAAPNFADADYFL